MSQLTPLTPNLAPLSAPDNPALQSLSDMEIFGTLLRLIFTTPALPTPHQTHNATQQAIA
jgi:hypothetical protein